MESPEEAIPPPGGAKAWFRDRRYLVVALVAHVVLATSYLLATPAFESPDEQDHFLYARQLLETGELPVVGGTARSLGLPAWREEPMGHHPPLYYAVLALFQRALGCPDLAPTLERRATALSGVVPEDGGPVVATHPLLWIHGWDEVAPISDEVRGFRLLRGLSVLCGAAALAATHALGRRAFPGKPAIAGWACVLLASWPQWSFTHAALHNDALADAFAHVALALLALALARGRLSTGLAAGLGAVLGLGLLTKLTLLSTAGTCALGVAWLVLRGPGSPARRLGAAAAGLATLLAVSGWFFARNQVLYGELLGLRAHVADYAAAAVRPDRLAHYLTRRLPAGTLRTLSGSFGWGGVQSPGWMQAVTVGLGGAALLGWLLPGRGSGADRRVVVVLVLAVLLALAAYVAYNCRQRQPQARFLFPAAGPAALLVTAGLARLLPERLAARGGRLAFSACLVPPVLAGTLAVSRVFPGLRFDPGEALDVQAALVLDLSTPREEPGTAIRLVEPRPFAELAEEPTFRWETAPSLDGSLYTLHLFDEGGRSLGATFEWARIRISAPAYRLPPGFWETLPRGVPVHWKVRRLPDRRAGESVRDVEESAASVFVRR